MTSNNTYNRRSFLEKSIYSMSGLVAGSLALPGLISSCKGKVNPSAINCLSGTISPEKLGITLMHEHVLLGNIQGHLRSASIDIAAKMLNDASAVGVQTLVDMTPYRDIHLYKEISEKTNVKIIASTGYYIREKMPAELRNISEAQLEDRMYKEVTEGIDGTGIKAGIIKIAADNQELSDWDKMIFRTAARVQKSTKVPIATHAWIGAVSQFELLVKHGADPNHINLAHIESVFGWRGKTREAISEELLQIVKGGGTLLFNNFSCEFYTPFQDMVYLMKYYCDKGFSNRIMISEDCNWTWKNEKQVFESEEEHPDARLRTYGYMMTHEVPLLLNSGFTKEDINTFLVDNPRIFFTV